MPEDTIAVVCTHDRRIADDEYVAGMQYCMPVERAEHYTRRMGDTVYFAPATPADAAALAKARATPVSAPATPTLREVIEQAVERGFAAGLEAGARRGSR